MKGRTAVILGLSLLGIALVYHFRNQLNLLSNYTSKLSGVRVKNFSRQTATIELSLTISNKSDINVAITGYDISGYLNGTLIGRAQSNAVTPLAAKRDSVLPIVITFSPQEIFASASNIAFLAGLFSKTSSLKISGAANIAVDGIAVKNIAINDALPLSF